MVWPVSDVNNTNTASGSTAGQPAAARLDIRDLITKFNQLINHFSTDTKAFVGAANNAAARTALGAAKSGQNTDITELFEINYERWRLRLPSNTAFANGASTVVFPSWDDGGTSAYNSTTGEWTCPANGVYAFDYSLKIQSATWTSASVQFSAQIWSPNQSIAYAFSQEYTPTTSPYISPILAASATLYLTAGAKIRLDINNGTGSSKNLIGGAQSDPRSYFNIHRLG